MDTKIRIIVNNSSMQPIYEQIVDQIKGQVLSGLLGDGDALPSVRGLAKELTISALTVKKAYDTLEEEGYVVTVHGKGSFIAAANPSLLAEERRREVEQYMETAVAKGRSCGLRDEELREILDLILESERA